MDFKETLLRLKSKSYSFAGFAISFFSLSLLCIIGLFVLLLISISLGWSYLSGFIFMVAAVILSGFCFILNAITNVFGKGRSVLFGALSLYLNLMSTLAFSAPEFFSGLGMQKWLSLSTMFFVFTAGGGIALVGFERFSKIISVIIIILNVSVFVPNNSFVRGLIGVSNSMGNLLSRKLNDLDQNLAPSDELIRQRYLDEFNRRKHELNGQFEIGTITAEEYERKMHLLEEKYIDKISVEENEHNEREANTPPVSVSSASQVFAPTTDEASEIVDNSVLTGFVENYIAAFNSGDIGRILMLYADKVNYYESGFVDKAFIQKDKSNYYKRWPEVYSALKNGVSISKVAGKSVYVLSFEVEYQVASPYRNKRSYGNAWTTLNVIVGENGVKVISENQMVSDRHLSGY
ncbi:MAG: hypothetical protein HGA49_10690 [Eubacteriaceae bacterium]|nr:hypothetical protein [Eubacteriaceae bacterium]